MHVRVALVPVDNSYLVDRVVSTLGGGQQFSHAALLTSIQRGEEETWHDVHWRWFVSDLRVIPAKNYAWPFEVYEILDMRPSRAGFIIGWLQEQKRRWIQYDLANAFRLLLKLPVRSTPRAYLCFEFVAQGLLAGGYSLDFKPEGCLASDLLQCGLLRKWTP